MVECGPCQQLNEVVLYHTVKKGEAQRKRERHRSQLQQQGVVEAEFSVRSTGLCVSRLISCQERTVMQFPACDPPTLSWHLQWIHVCEACREEEQWHHDLHTVAEPQTSPVVVLYKVLVWPVQKPFNLQMTCWSDVLHSFTVFLRGGWFDLKFWWPSEPKFQSFTHLLSCCSNRL